MGTLMVDIPDDVAAAPATRQRRARSAQKTGRDPLARWLLPLGKARRLDGLSRRDFEALLSNRQVSPELHRGRSGGRSSGTSRPTNDCRQRCLCSDSSPTSITSRSFGEGRHRLHLSNRRSSDSISAQFRWRQRAGWQSQERSYLRRSVPRPSRGRRNPHPFRSPLVDGRARTGDGGCRRGGRTGSVWGARRNPIRDPRTQQGFIASSRLSPEHPRGQRHEIHSI